MLRTVGRRARGGLAKSGWAGERAEPADAFRFALDFRKYNYKTSFMEKTKIDIEEAEHGARIEPAVIADMMPGP